MAKTFAGSTLTPSPIMDALGVKTCELFDGRLKLSADALIKEDKQQRQKSKPGQYTESNLDSRLTRFTQDPCPLLHPMLLVRMIRR
jgi:hypothetical protein